MILTVEDVWLLMFFAVLGAVLIWPATELLFMFIRWFFRRTR